jgi:hypothetical protein
MFGALVTSADRRAQKRRGVIVGHRNATTELVAEVFAHQFSRLELQIAFIGYCQCFPTIST